MARPNPPNKPSKKPAPQPARGKAPAKSARAPRQTLDHEGATEAQTGDRTGPGAGYDTQPQQVRKKGGVST